MMRTLSAVLLCLVAAMGCAAPANAIKDDNAAVDVAAKATIQYKLTPISTDCLFFDTADKGKDYLVRVRERHDQHCGGLDVTSPTVFFMRVQKIDGHITTNAYNPASDGFEELKQPARSQ